LGLGEWTGMVYGLAGAAFPSAGAVRVPRAARQGRRTHVGARAAGRRDGVAGSPKGQVGCPESETGTCEVSEHKVYAGTPHHKRVVDPTKSQSELGCPDSETGMCDVPEKSK